MPKTVNLKIDKFLGLVSDNAGDTNLKIGQCSTFTNFKTIEGYKAKKRDGYLAQLTTATGQPIKGQWYGEINNVAYHLFASNGHIYRNVGDGSTTDLGAMTTSNGVEFFYFGDCVYMQNGTEYKKWTGTGTISDVSGYIPKIMVSRNMGSIVTGTSYEGLNNLTTQRRMTFNGVSAQTIAYLPETNITSVDSVLVNGVLQTVTTHYTVDLVAGTVTFGTAPSVALDNVEITWTNLAKTEFFNGTGSQTVFQLSETNITSVSSVTLPNTFRNFTSSQYQEDLIIQTDSPHFYIDNQPIKFTGSSLPSGITQGTTYYVGTRDSTSFFVRNTSGGITKGWISDGSGTVDIVLAYTSNTTNGTVTFGTAPPNGTNNVIITYQSATTNYGDISRQTHNRIYGGKNDSRVFFFGYDNSIYYSGLADGVPSAEYFPVLNYIQVGSNNSNVTDLAKMFDRLIIFKESTTGWSTYEYDSSLGVQFPTYPLNDSIGCSVKGSVQIIRNNPFTVFGNTIQELVSSNVRDERTYPKDFKSKDIQPLLNAETMTSVITFDNQADLEYWLIIGTKAYIYNYNFEVWYYYEFAHTITSIEYVNGYLMLGTSTGQLMKIAYAYATDNTTAIVSTIKTGRINYGTSSYKKMVNNAWVEINRNGAATSVTFKADADGVSDRTVKTLSYTTETEPITVMCQPKLKPFDYVQYSFYNNSADKLTVVSLEAPAVLTVMQK